MIGCGLLQANYAFHNVSRKSYITVKYFTKMVRYVAHDSDVLHYTDDCVCAGYVRGSVKRVV